MHYETKMVSGIWCVNVNLKHVQGQMILEAIYHQNMAKLMVVLLTKLLLQIQKINELDLTFGYLHTVNQNGREL